MEAPVTVPRNLSLYAACLLVACSRPSAERSAPDAAPPPPPPSAASTHPSEPAPPRPAPASDEKLPCRATVVTGDVTAAGAKIAAGEQLPEPTFLDLAAGARLAVKVPRSARDLTFEGPAHARVCVDFKDEVWLATGTFTAGPSAGQAPGSEVLIATPFGAFRYVAATLKATATTKLELAVTAGSVLLRPAATAHVSPPDAGGKADWLLIDAGTTVTLDAKAGPETLRLEVEACTASATLTQNLARKLNDRYGESLGVLAAAHIEARRRARADCAIARADLANHPQKTPSLADELTKADALWTSLGQP
jgi:hypothetical protein